jgi:hypothetical protein
MHHSIRYCALILAVLMQPVLAQDSAPNKSTSEVFLLPYFLGNGETGVYIAYSHDGLKFQWLNDGQVVMPAPAWGDESLTRDPSIVYHDNVFHLVWTTSWTSRSIGYAHSHDLKTGVNRKKSMSGATSPRCEIPGHPNYIGIPSGRSS